jgi:bifunctional ADP-heptose synthase (sugar kinase/adenylyltransferase)
MSAHITTGRVSRQQLQQASVLVVGDAMLDRYWYGAVDRISPEAPVPVVKVTSEEERIGAAANVAYNVVTLGARASFLGVVGELQQVVGSWRDAQELATKAQQLRQHLALGALLVTLGEDGMTLFDEAGALHVDAQAREVFDVTGAGDTVIATLATLVAAGQSLREAMPLANKAGGIVVGKFGTATVSYEELFE